ncbi:hypothetical protein DUNSADRAFT_9705, partial [Dunaliella salina]
MSGLPIRRLLLALEHLGPSSGALFNATSLCQQDPQKISSVPGMLHPKSEDIVQAHGLTGHPCAPNSRVMSSFAARNGHIRRHCQISDSSREQTEVDASRKVDREGKGNTSSLTKSGGTSSTAEAAKAEELRQQQWDLEDDLWGDHFTGGGVREPTVSEEGELNLPSGMEIVGMAAMG